MKQVYMPSEEELYIMQDKGLNLYKYILVKAIESIIMDIKINENYISESKSIINNIKNRLIRENPYIEQAICRLYPEEIPNTVYAKQEAYICLAVTNPNYNQDNSIYNLDNLAKFDNGVFSNLIVRKNTINTLIEKLPLSPAYRFEYKQNKLLDDIFGCRISTDFLSISYEDLAKIEPAYLLKQSKYDLNKVVGNSSCVDYYINEYAKRYGFSSSDCNEYWNQDILTNPDADVKRLMKCIKKRTR